MHKMTIPFMVVLSRKRAKGMVINMNRRTFYKRWTSAVSIILHALLLLTAYVLQGVIFPYMRLTGLVPLLLPVVSTGAAVYQGRIAGGVVGIFAGILCDISFNEPVGMFTVLLTLTGLVVGAVADTFMARGFVTFFFSCVAVLIVSAFAQMFPLLFFERVPPTPLLLVGFWQTVYSLICALPLWFFVRALGLRAQRVSPPGRPL